SRPSWWTSPWTTAGPGGHWRRPAFSGCGRACWTPKTPATRDPITSTCVFGSGSCPIGSPQGSADLESHRRPPTVARRDFMDGASRRDVPATGGVAERHAAGHDPSLVGWDPEDGVRLRTVEDAQDGGEGAAHPLGPGRQL